ncbi:type II toxin-antitoxin system Phd/YefM family antitoxin [Clostridium sp. 'deep sea']|uniref:type II toxin-antitoxin system prevent-host-death family antitoxin n=1 Tax=Clostridium sp. 'deep sea' TaxID=2779445 RepID=UPI001896550F|nr:type II toxin-antitoxin system prevent-host-death family antitoxin [Clostridium sp. 'deep sea']QOR34490.1 type II toxin-antitoxin system Phd/YefM family antitoxin [Clostridium sp. 'deep sea']
MPNIMPVSDLRNYTDVLKNVDVDSPVFLTKNGRGRYVIVDIKEYEKQEAKLKLLAMLQESEESVKNGDEWLTLNQVKKDLEV